MSRKHWVLLGLLVALLLLIALPRLMPRRKDYPDRLAVVDTSLVSRMIISKGADSLQVERIGAGWRLTSPVSWPADPRTVAGVLDVLGDLKVTALANPNPQLAADPDYDLDAGRVLRLRVFQGDQAALDLRLGRSSRDYSGSFVRLEGQEAIYRLAAEIGSRVPAGRGRWLDKLICQENADSLVLIEVRRAEGVICFEHADSTWKMRWEPLRGTGWSAPRVNERPFEDLKSALCNLRMSDLPTPAQTAALAEASPVVSHVLVTKDGRRQVFQWLKLETEENLVFVQCEGQSGGFAVYRGLMDRLTIAAEEYRTSLH